MWGAVIADDAPRDVRDAARRGGTTKPRDSEEARGFAIKINRV
jgi:hypothetical protein